MAKGDHKRVQNELDRQWNDQAQYLSTLSNRLYDTSNMFTEGYRAGMPMNLGSYDEIMANYRNFMQNPLGAQMGFGMPTQSGQFNPMAGMQQQGMQFGGGNSGVDPLQYIQQRQQQLPANRDSMNQIVRELQQMGVPVALPTHNQGKSISSDKIVLPDGRVYDVGGNVNPATGQFDRWVLDLNDIYSGDRTVAGPDGNLIPYSQFLQSHGIQNIPQGMQGGMGGMGMGFGGGEDYSGILGDFYKNLMENGGGLGWDSLFRGALENAIGGYGEFAETGGLSERDRQDLRARGEGAVRAVYGNMMDNLNRQRSLQPYGANYASAASRMARERSYANADALANNNANIAQMVQQGRLAGLGGLTQAGLGGQAASSRIDEGNLGARLSGASGLRGLENDADAMALANAGLRLQALQGMSGLYGTTPGLINTFGNQVLGANQQLLGLNELRQGLGGQMIQGRLQGSQVPGNWSQAMGNIGSGLGLVGNIAGAFMGMGGLGGLNPFGGGGGVRGLPAGMPNAGGWNPYYNQGQRY